MPDSFKGTMSSVTVCHIIKEEILKVFPLCNVLAIPVADGGEGTAEAFAAAYQLPCKRLTVETVGALGDNLKGTYMFFEQEKMAVIELASVVGLPLIEKRENPLKTSTYGVGLLISDALDKGAKKILLGLGGTSTNDGGCGCLCALGVAFRDKEDKKITPVGENLKDIQTIDRIALDKRLKDIEIIGLCDVRNPMYGSNGAAQIFAPQKGADQEMVKELDAGLRHLASLIDKNFGVNVQSIEGSGAAGGFGGGLIGIIGGRLAPGATELFKLLNQKLIFSDCDLVITGEGKLDKQTLEGKVVFRVLELAKKCEVKVLIIAGIIEKEAIEGIHQLGDIEIIKTNKSISTIPPNSLAAQKNLKRTIGIFLKNYFQKYTCE